MADRSTSSRRRGSLSERLFAGYLERNNVPFFSTVGTQADLKGKTDFIVEGKRVQVKAPSGNGLEPTDFCIEHRAVNGDNGWLWTADYIVKFCDHKSYYRIDAAELRYAVAEYLPEPPEQAPRGKAKVMGGWYARPDWKGRDRSKECCYIVPLSWLETYCKPVHKTI